MRGRVVGVVDGDTIPARIGTRVEKGRSIGVNAPEVPHDARGWQTGGEEGASSIAHRGVDATCIERVMSRRGEATGGWSRTSSCAARRGA